MERIPLVDLKNEYLSMKSEIDTAVREVIESFRFINGKRGKEFSSEFAKYCGAKYGVGASSGTTALSLALICSGVKPGDEVITTPFTFIATAEAIATLGAKPVFADAGDEAANISPDEAGKKITRKTKAIVAVHLYGAMADIDALQETAEQKNDFIL